MKKIIFSLSLMLISLGTLTFAQELNLNIPQGTVSFLFHGKNTEGTLKGFTATIKMDPNHPEKASIVGTVETKTIETGIEGRDHHLASADFFDAEKYPTMSFSATKIKKSDDGFVVIGNLTIKDITKEEKFQLVIKDGVFTLKTTISTSNYGIMADKSPEETKTDITVAIPVL